MKYNANFYNQEYYCHGDSNNIYNKGCLKIQDEFAALCYAHGFDKYWEVEKIMGIREEDSLRFYGNHHSINQLKCKTEEIVTRNLISLYDSVWIKGENISSQINKIELNKKRIPKGILEVGGGRGELSLVFANMGYLALNVEPSEKSHEMLEETKKIFNIYKDVKIIKEINELQSEEENNIDTIIFSCSIEHIYKEDLYLILDRCYEILNKTKGILIIVNTISYHPIFKDEDGQDHVTTIDDNFYDKISNNAKKVIYREGSHLILQF
jgi:ubiquinone/menaquinone biosynthesis C-methylase UbiE